MSLWIFVSYRVAPSRLAGGSSLPLKIHSSRDNEYLITRLLAVVFLHKYHTGRYDLDWRLNAYPDWLRQDLQKVFEVNGRKFT